MSIDILNLRAQRQILRYSVDYLQDKIALLAAERKTREREMKQDERRRRGVERDQSMSGAETESEEEPVHQRAGEETLYSLITPNSGERKSKQSQVPGHPLQFRML